jgi:hypothetical protein
MRHVSAISDLRLMTQEHKELHFPVTIFLLYCAERDENFLKLGSQVLKYVYGLRSRSKIVMKIPFLATTVKKAHKMLSKTEVTLPAFSDNEGVVDHKYAPYGLNIKRHFCL